MKDLTFIWFNPVMYMQKMSPYTCHLSQVTGNARQVHIRVTFDSDVSEVDLDNYANALSQRCAVPGVSQNIALHASPTARNFFLALM